VFAWQMSELMPPYLKVNVKLAKGNVQDIYINCKKYIRKWAREDMPDGISNPFRKGEIVKWL